MLRRALTVLSALLLACLTVFGLAGPAAAEGPVTNYFYGAYDYRFEQPYSCFGRTCWYIPKTDGVSYYNAPVITMMWVRDSVDGRVNSDNYAVSVGQNVGVMCWKASTTSGKIWLQVDFRHNDDEGNSALWVGWVLDDNVRVSYANRTTYVAECGYYKTLAP